MSIKVRVDPFLQEFTDSKEIVDVTGHTVSECLDNLESQFPGIKKQLGKWDGAEFKLFPDIMICVNSESSCPEELARPVKNGDELTLGVVVFGG